MASFWITEHVHVCIIQDVVWLNRKNGTYHKTAGSKNEILGRLVHGWPLDEEDTRGGQHQIPPTLEAQQALASELARKGLISARIENGHRYTRPAVIPVVSTIEQDEAAEVRTVCWHHWQRMFHAYVTIRFALRVGKLHSALSGIERKKYGCNNTSPLDYGEVRRLVGVFRYLRLFLYTPRLHCLFDSLVLARFLIAYGLAPSLVIGVTVGPFRAHSWVQLEGAVAIGELDYVQRFSPILVI